MDRPLDSDTIALLENLNKTRRMKRDVSKIGLDPSLYGVDGEFYFGPEEDGSVVNYNLPPSTQPSLWCGWKYANGKIVWDEVENFYGYKEWIRYIIDKILIPRGTELDGHPYTLNGAVTFVGENPDDRGVILILNNVIKLFEKGESMAITG